MIYNSTSSKNTFFHMFLGWLNCTVGKHNQVRLHWNRGYDNAPEAKDNAFDFFICCKLFDIGFANSLKLERCVHSGSVSLYNFVGIDVRPRHPKPKTLSSNPSFSAAFFRAHSVQIGLAICNFFFGMVTCFQIKH